MSQFEYTKPISRLSSGGDLLFFFLVIGQPLFREQDKVLEIAENKLHGEDNMAVKFGEINDGY